MAPDRLELDDPRVERREVKVRGLTYSYILAKPEGEPLANVFLVHGFPDLGWGWRHQVPYLTAKGYVVAVPDMLGFGRTDAPDAAEEYTLKLMSDDIASVAADAFGPGSKIILGGHDWGGALVWRTALWRPDVVSGVFSVCTPYAPPAAQYVDLAHVIAAGHLKNFGYQLQFRGEEAEKGLQTGERIRQFLNSMFAGRGPNGEFGFSPEKGVLFENLDVIGPSPLISKDDVDSYVREYLRHGIHGPLNWYRTRERNFEDERPLVEEAAKSDGGVLKFKMPGMMIAATKDTVLLPAMSLGMEKYFEPGAFARREVESNHWALWITADAVNANISEWIEGFVLKGEEGAVKASL